MPVPVPVTLSTYATTGSAVRLRTYAYNANTLTWDTVDEKAMTESPAGSGQFLYTSTLSLTDNAGPYHWEARVATAQTQVAYDASIDVVRTRGLLGWVVGGVMLDSAADVRGVNGQAVEMDDLATLIRGSGPYAINESGGVGAGSVAATLDTAAGTTYATWATDALRYTTDGATGYPNLRISAYLKSTWDTAPGTGLAGQAQSGSDGRWVAPLNLASGDYVILADDPDDSYVASRVTIRVP